MNFTVMFAAEGVPSDRGRGDNTKPQRGHLARASVTVTGRIMLKAILSSVRWKAHQQWPQQVQHAGSGRLALKP